MSNEPYVGGCWMPGVVTADNFSFGLPVIVRDLAAALKENPVVGECIELWLEDDSGARGFFVGDTSELAGKGWSKVIDL